MQFKPWKAKNWLVAVPIVGHFKKEGESCPELFKNGLSMSEYFCVLGAKPLILA